MDNHDIIDKLLCPEITLDVDGAKIHLRGPDGKMEQWIQSPRTRTIDEKGNIVPFAPKDQDDLELVGAEIFSRMMRVCVQKVEGVAFRDGDKLVEYTVEKDPRGIMTVRSYTALMKILNRKPELIGAIDAFYKQTVNVDQYIEIKKK